MNRTRLLMIGALALALGVIVSLSVYKNLQGRGSGSSEPGTDVIVAADDIQVGARIEEHDVRIVKYPASALPGGTYGKRSQVMGRGVIIPISQGRIYSAQQTCAGECRSWPAFTDSAGNARRLGAGERSSLGRRVSSVPGPESTSC